MDDLVALVDKAYTAALAEILDGLERPDLAPVVPASREAQVRDALYHLAKSLAG